MSLPVLAMKATSDILKERFATCHPAERAASLSALERILDMPHEVVTTLKQSLGREILPDDVFASEPIKTDDRKQPAVEPTLWKYGTTGPHIAAKGNAHPRTNTTLIEMVSQANGASTDDVELMAHGYVRPLIEPNPSWETDLFMFGKFETTSSSMNALSSPAARVAQRTFQPDTQAQFEVLSNLSYSPAFLSPMFLGERSYSFGADGSSPI